MRLRLTKLASYTNKDGLKVKLGEVVEVDDEKTAQYLLKMGYFEEVKEEKKAKK